MSIFIGIPSYDGWVHTMLIESLMNQEGVDMVMVFANGIYPVSAARNKLLKDFLTGDYSHLLMLDADTIPPPDAIRRLVQADKGIISGVTPILRDSGITSNVYMDTEPMDMRMIHLMRDLFKAKGVGASCLLIRKDVAADMAEAFQHPFQEEWHEGHFIGEDIGFCNNARLRGHDIWIDPLVSCKHVREVLI